MNRKTPKYPRFCILKVQDKDTVFWTDKNEFGSKSSAMVFPEEVANAIAEDIRKDTDAKIHVLTCTHMRVMQLMIGDGLTSEDKYWSESKQEPVPLPEATIYFSTRLSISEELPSLRGYAPVPFKTAYLEWDSKQTEEASDPENEDEVSSSELETEVGFVLDTIRSNHRKIIELRENVSSSDSVTVSAKRSIQEAYLLSSAIHLTNLNNMFFESEVRERRRRSWRDDTVDLLDLRGNIENLFSMLDRIATMEEMDDLLGRLKSSIKEVIFIISRRSKNICSVFEIFPNQQRRGR